tara:strand:- start:21 stop:191 length:171 start_codon:yes stop_codon:yes gene_type:complete
MISTVEKKYFNGLFVSYEVILDNGTKWSVPDDETNRHYQEILEWVANGGTIIDNGA